MDTSSCRRFALLITLLLLLSAVPASAVSDGCSSLDMGSCLASAGCCAWNDLGEGEGWCSILDDDVDYVCDAEDICPGWPDGEDWDEDGVPDGCDICDGDDNLDEDSDGVPDACDNCPDVSNDQADADEDYVGDACDVCPGFDDTTDDDEDGVPDGCDVCSGWPDGEDPDEDGVPDGCDICDGDDNLDEDSDGVPDACDICPGTSNPEQDETDNDEDGVPDECDNCQPAEGCPGRSNYLNSDATTCRDIYNQGTCENSWLYGRDTEVAQSCYWDEGEGGWCYGCGPNNEENGYCVNECTGWNPEQEDSDEDGVGDACDLCAGSDDDGQDSDEDGVPDACDNCPDDENYDQEDGDSDGVGDACDNCAPDDLLCEDHEVVDDCYDLDAESCGGGAEWDDEKAVSCYWGNGYLYGGEDWGEDWVEDACVPCNQYNEENGYCEDSCPAPTCPDDAYTQDGCWNIYDEETCEASASSGEGWGTFSCFWNPDEGEGGEGWCGACDPWSASYYGCENTCTWWNPEQEDGDEDGAGDLCDLCEGDDSQDADEDGIPDACDVPPLQYRKLVKLQFWSGETLYTVQATGDAEVSEDNFEEGDGWWTQDTSIEAELDGMLSAPWDNAYPVTVRESGSGGDSQEGGPIDSFFDVFVELDIEGEDTWFTEEPVHLEALRFGESRENVCYKFLWEEGPSLYVDGEEGSEYMGSISEYWNCFLAESADVTLADSVPDFPVEEQFDSLVSLHVYDTWNERQNGEVINLMGPTVVRRSAPQQGEGTYIETELISMELTGMSQMLGPVQVSGSGGGNAYSGEDWFPAESFFDVFFDITWQEIGEEVTVPQHGAVQTQLQATIFSLPWTPICHQVNGVWLPLQSSEGDVQADSETRYYVSQVLWCPLPHYGLGFEGLELEHDFGDSWLDLSDIEVERGSGWIIVRGLELPEGETKTVTFDSATGSGLVCVKDIPGIADISEVSSICSGEDEVLVSCPGSAGDYTCEFDGDSYTVSGLRNSAVAESTPPPPPPPPSSSGSSGGGGSSYTCQRDWECSDWGTCQAPGTQTRTCVDANGCSSSKTVGSVTYPVILYGSAKPEESQSCEYEAPEETGSGSSPVELEAVPAAELPAEPESESSIPPTGLVTGEVGSQGGFPLWAVALLLLGILAAGVIYWKRR